MQFVLISSFHIIQFGTKQLSDLSLVLYDAKVGNNSTLVVKPAEKRRAATKAPVTDATDSLNRKVSDRTM